MTHPHRPWGLTLLTLALASGLSLSAQEGAHRPQPDPGAEFKQNDKRFSEDPDKVTPDEAWGRQQWFLERMGGELGPDFYERVVREAAKERAKYPYLFADAAAKDGIERPVAVVPGAWVNIGPTSSNFTQNGVQLTKVDSGRGRAILPHPTDPNTVYFLNAGGGLWKTTNFTAATPTWTPTTDFLGSTAGGAAAFGRTPSTLYYGAGDSFDGGVGGFVAVSTDSAATWSTPVHLGSATRIHALAVDTTDPADILLVGTNTGLFRSTNGGTSFTQVGTGTIGNVGVWTIVKTSAGWLASTVNGGIGSLYISMDKGATWAAITSPISGIGRSTLAVGAPGDATVYCFAATTNNSAQKDLYKSTDGGQTWTALNINAKVPTGSNADQSNMNLMAGQAFYNQMILVDPSDATRNTVYLGGQLSSAKTTNGGSTWTLTSNWLPRTGISLPYVHADFHTAAFSNAGGTNRLFFGTDGGLFTSTDGGTTWDDTKNKGLATHLIFALAVNPTVTGSALIGLQDNGTRARVLSPSPSSVFNQIRGGDGFGVGWAPASGYSMSSYVYNDIQRSTTNPPTTQSNWVDFVTGLPAQTSSNFYFVTPIISPTAQADPTGTAFFTYGRTGGIYQSNDSGWKTIGSAGTAGIGAGRTVRGVSHGIGVHPSDLQRIAAAGSSGYLMITTNGGQTWTERFLGTTGSDGVSGWYGLNANVAWATDQILYACSESTTAGAAHVAKSTDGGATWTRKDSGLPDVPVTKIAVDYGDGSGNTAYAATWLGVYRTTDGGASWTLFGTGLPQGRVSDIYVAPDGSFIRVATWGRGVWEMTNVPVAGTMSITPTSALLYVGDTQTFTGTVAGGGTVTYTATGGSINASTGLLNTTGATPGVYTVTATNAGSPSNSAVANVIIAVPTPVTFPSQPTSVTAGVGQTATFTVVATGTGPLTYQWKKNGSVISSATSASYTTPTLVAGDNGSTFLCEVTGKAGMVASNPASLTVMNLGTAVQTSSTTVTAIPDATSGGPGTAVEVPFVVSGMTGNVGEVQFSLYLTHTYAGDLQVDLVSPSNTVINLAKGIALDQTASNSGAAFGTSCGNYTVFADSGSTSIQTVSVSNLPLVGTYKPAAPLSGFTNQTANGTWKLRIQDLGPADVGSFQCGVLSIRPLVALAPSFDIDGNGVVDAYDLLAFLKRFGSTAPANLAVADFNMDGQINDADLTLLLNNL